MKSVNRRMRSILSMNKNGQVLNATTGTVIGIMIMIFMVFAVLYGISALNPKGFFTTSSTDYNATVSLQENLSRGIQTFGDQIPTVFKVLAVVLAISAIAILILYVRRMGGGQETVGL